MPKKPPRKRPARRIHIVLDRPTEERVRRSAKGNLRALSVELRRLITKALDLEQAT